MIKGLTHNEDGELNRITKYKGKISAGFAPGEGPNKTNYPVAAGFFRMLKEVVISKRIGQSKTIVPVKEWIVNEPVQTALEKSCNNPQPRRIEVICLFKEINEMWESSLAMYSGTEGLMCKGHGVGSDAKYLTFNGSERVWTTRPCLYRECPDFKAGKCKALGLLKSFPSLDMATNPYRFETRSLNTILGMESSLNEIFMLMKAAHMVRQYEASKVLPFDGLFGAKLFLIHRKVKSGGKQVFITDIEPTPEFAASIMEPIKRGLSEKAKQSTLIGEAGSMTLLGNAAERLLEISKLASADVQDSVPLELDAQRELAVNFGADADDEEVLPADDLNQTEVVEDIAQSDLNKAAVNTLLENEK